MEIPEQGYTADDLLIRLVCTEIINEHELSSDIHPALCRWAVEVLNSCDSNNDITRLLLTAKLAKAFEDINGTFH